MFHYRKKFKDYAKAKGTAASCPFCDPHEANSRLIEETKYSIVLPNLWFYDVWELRSVTDHLMIIPKRHVASLQELTPAEQRDVMQLMGKYEADDYNIYARGKNSEIRSVAHQHTHLIKTKGPTARGIFGIRKPYWLIKF